MNGWIVGLTGAAMGWAMASAGAEPAAAAAGGGGVVEAAATLQKLAGGFKFTEGATCDPTGNVFFVDQPNNRIHTWSVADGKFSTFMDPAGYANGMCFDTKGRLIACADEKNELWSIAPDGRVTVLLKEFEGKPLNGPNDVWVHPDGAMYFTDPYYQRPWWKHQGPPQAQKGVYRLAPGAKAAVCLESGFNQPNGIVGTPDGKRLYLSEIGAGRIWRYDIGPDGSLARKTRFCDEKSDGMTLDSEGNVYLTNNEGVVVVGPDGQRVQVIAVPEKWAGNVCFGGADRRTLFIAASTGFYSIRMRVKGANPAK